jgi:hypothetical protein
LIFVQQHDDDDDDQSELKRMSNAQTKGSVGANPCNYWEIEETTYSPEAVTREVRPHKFGYGHFRKLNEINEYCRTKSRAMAEGETDEKTR